VGRRTPAIEHHTATGIGAPLDQVLCMTVGEARVWATVGMATAIANMSVKVDKPEACLLVIGIPFSA
jgi:hypothetical protein